MQAKITTLENNHTWYVVDLPPGKKAIGYEHVFKQKSSIDGKLERYKDCIMAKGYTQQKGNDFLDTFSPVAKIFSIHTLLVLAVAKQWHLY